MHAMSSMTLNVTIYGKPTPLTPRISLARAYAETCRNGSDP